MALKIQVSHRHQTHHLYPVFLQSSVTNLPIPKLAFDNAEQVLYPRTNARLLAIPLAKRVFGLVKDFGASQPQNRLDL